MILGLPQNIVNQPFSKFMVVSFFKRVKVQNFCYGKEAMFFRVQLLFKSNAKFKVFFSKCVFNHIEI